MTTTTTTTTLRRAALAAAILLPMAGIAEAAGAQDFSWNGTVNRDGWVQLRNLNGAVIVEAATGNQVEVTAVKKAGRRGDTSAVRIVAVQPTSGGTATICALWDEAGTCEEGEYRATRNNRDDSDEDDGRRNVSVEFRVKLPAGVRLDASTVNGKIRIAGATSEVRARSVNGGIEATSSGGPVRASTVNGGIDVRMASLAGTESLQYSTVNGSVKVHLPADVNAEIELSTVNGGLESDFPLTMQGRMDRRNIKARLGNGGPRITFSTVNGSVRLLKL